MSVAENMQIRNSDKFSHLTNERKATRLNGIVFFLVCLTPILANLLFGAVSTATLAILVFLLGILLFFWFADAWKSKEICFSNSLLQLPILGLILIGLIQLIPIGAYDFTTDLLSILASSTLSLDPNATKLAIVKLCIFLIFFSISLSNINNRKRLRIVASTVIIFGGIMAFLGILQNLAKPNFIYGLRKVDYASPFASYVNGHHFAAFMEMTIGLTFAILVGQSTKRDKRLLLLIAISLMGMAIVFTGSRGGFLSLIGVMSSVIVMTFIFKGGEVNVDKTKSSDFKNYVVLIGGSIMLLLVLIAAVIWLGGSDDVTRGVGLRTNQTDTTNGRLHFWNISLKIISGNPILGTGLETFGVAFTRYDTWNGRLRVEHAHNDYLQILTDAGVLGFICIASFIFMLFKRSLHVIRNTSNIFRKHVAIGSLAGCIGILLHSLVDFPLRTNANSLFFLLLASLATVPIDYPKLQRKPKLSRTD